MSYVEDYRPKFYGDYEHAEDLFDRMNECTLLAMIEYFELKDALNRYKAAMPRLINMFDSKNARDRLDSVIEFKNIEFDMRIEVLNLVRYMSYTRRPHYAGGDITNSNQNWLIDRNYDKFIEKYKLEHKEDLEECTRAFELSGGIPPHFIPVELYVNTKQYDDDQYEEFLRDSGPEDVRDQEHQIWLDTSDSDSARAEREAIEAWNKLDRPCDSYYYT